ncbi:MAG: GDSL-type esterase/lipase family protein [Gammaproteobacteria bacterium]|nr:GDSL-type esterase/lipase family protein [Gammaproteobacteria bacterium]
MQTISLKETIPSEIAVEGAFGYDIRPEGLGIRRLPDWTRPYVPQGLEVMLKMASGVRLRLNTNATKIGIDAVTTSMGFRPNAKPFVRFDLQRNGHIDSQSIKPTNVIVPKPESPTQYEIDRGTVETAWFSDSKNTGGNLEIWLPHNAYVSLQQIHIDGDLLPLEPEDRPRWVHYGSSISHCMEAESPSQTWPGVASRRARFALTSLGFGGQCHLDPFVARTIAQTSADLISIKVGINVVNLDSMRERVFVPMIHGFLDTIREAHPSTQICLVSPIFCPSAEDRPGPTIPNNDGKFETIEGFQQLRQGCLTLRRIRDILQEVVEIRRNQSDLCIDYFDGLNLFSEADQHLLPDHLHPNNEGYRLMGERFADSYLSPKRPQIIG